MAHSKTARLAKSRRVRYLAYAIPLIALIGVAAIYTLSVLPVQTSPAAQDFTFKLVTQISNKNSTSIRGLVPVNSIGEPGGYWNTSQYSSYGVDSGHYPIYMDTPTIACNPPPVCLVHVKSTVVRQYTLGDLFNVWGKSLGQNYTEGIHSNGNFLWQLCVAFPPANAAASNEWGNLVLQSGMDITLFFYDVTQFGCAAS